MTVLRRAAVLLGTLALLVCVSSAVAASLPSATLASFSPSSVSHSSVARVADLRTHVEESHLTLTVKNSGSASLSSYLLAVPGDKAPRLAFLEVQQGKSKLLPVETTITGLPSISAAADPEGSSALKNATFFSVSLSPALAAGSSTELKVLLVFTRTLRPYPEAIEQADQQYVMWDDSSVFYSPYSTAAQELQVRLASAKVESFTKRSGSATAKRSGDDLRYAQTGDAAVAPFSRFPISVHSVNNAPFVTFTSLSKDIEVSHWGNVAVQDNVLLSHTGAKLRGAFTRFDYERTRTGEQAPASFRTLVAELPRTAKDIYYRDCIGNVSTSHVRRAAPGVKEGAVTRVEIDPRFPMFGGWNADFNLGYNLPSQQYLSVDDADSSRFVLRIPFGAPVASAAIDELTVRVILPEGATDIEWQTPFDISASAMTEFKTYLDTTGRPTLILTKRNAVRQHNVNFVVVYRFGSSAILREPLLVTGAVFALLMLVVAYNHADLRIVDSASGSSSSSSASVPSKLRSRRAGTAVGASVQEILENLLARPHGLLALAEERGIAAREAAAPLLASLGKELGQALHALEKEEQAFAASVSQLTTAIPQLVKAAARYTAAAPNSQEAKQAREQTAEAVDLIHAQAQKIADL